MPGDDGAVQRPWVDTPLTSEREHGFLVWPRRSLVIVVPRFVLVGDGPNSERLLLRRAFADVEQHLAEVAECSLHRAAPGAQRPPVKRRREQPLALVVIRSGDRITPVGGSGTAEVQRGPDGIGVPVTYGEPLKLVAEAERGTGVISG
ncbi:hypothetical protein JNW90_06790 [Micromonospora sp. STR1s_5]|nr:hypothetical protein [Micromonospora sp. STR1s_5]